jgi:hypothetical protein
MKAGKSRKRRFEVIDGGGGTTPSSGPAVPKFMQTPGFMVGSYFVAASLGAIALSGALGASMYNPTLG